MIVGIVLLAQDDCYVGPNGELPERPAFDKKFITQLAKGRNIVCSENTAKVLPNSIKRVANDVTQKNQCQSTDVNFGISTFRSTPPDMMIIIRSPQETIIGGKEFDFTELENEYILVYCNTEIEIWIN